MSYSRNAGSVPHKGGGRLVQKTAVPIAKVAVYLLAFASWAFAMLLMYGILEMIFRGHFENWSKTAFPKSPLSSSQPCRATQAIKPQTR